MAKTYGVGYDGTVTGIGQCPFDMDRLQKEYSEGSESSTKKIDFGAGLEDGSGKSEVPLLANSCFFETATSSLRNTNLIKPGSAKASDFWGVISDSVIVPKLVQKLHEGAVDKIIVSSWMSIGNEGAEVVQTFTYDTCFMKLVDPVSYGFLTLFSFAFSRVTINQSDIEQTSNGGVHARAGQYVYVFDYTAGSGAAG